MTFYTGMEGIRISNCLSAPVNEVLVCAAAMILKIFFCSVKISPLFEELSQKYIPYFITEPKYTNALEYVSFTDMDRGTKGVKFPFCLRNYLLHIFVPTYAVINF